MSSIWETNIDMVLKLSFMYTDNNDYEFWNHFIVDCEDGLNFFSSVHVITAVSLWSASHTLLIPYIFANILIDTILQSLTRLIYKSDNSMKRTELK